MTAKTRKQIAKELFKMPIGILKPLDLSEAAFIPDGLTRAYRNNRVTVMVYDDTKTTHGNCIRALIQQHDDLPIKNHWSQIQDIKNQIFGGEATAIEYYPAESDLINEHNIYWIWIFPEGVIPKMI